jgi:tetratricopeptide (TPR) repeat protein
MRGIALSLAVILFAVAPALAEDSRENSAGTPKPSGPIVQKSPAELRADQLDRLFARLHGVADAGQAQSIEQGIWKIWMSADSPTAEILLQQATKAMGDGAPEQSLTILNRLIGAYPEFAEAWNKRATLYFLMKKYPESLADIDKVLELEPRHFGALSGRGMIYQRQNKYSAALDSFHDALAINPSMQSVKDAVEQIEKLEQGI